VLKANIPAIVLRDDIPQHVDLVELTDQELHQHLAEFNYRQHKELVRVLVRRLRALENKPLVGLLAARNLLTELGAGAQFVTALDALLDKDEEILTNEDFLKAHAKLHLPL
jgi:hypothetical protein